MKPIELGFRMTIEGASLTAVVDLLQRALHSDTDVDVQHEARIKALRNPLFAGQKPPEDRGLLIDINQVAKLLQVPARAVWKMAHSGEMPKAIRFGNAVRWGYEEIKE